MNFDPKHTDTHTNAMYNMFFSFNIRCLDVGLWFFHPIHTCIHGIYNSPGKCIGADKRCLVFFMSTVVSSVVMVGSKQMKKHQITQHSQRSQPKKYCLYYEGKKHINLKLKNEAMLPLERTNQAHMYISGYAVSLYACQTLWYLCMRELNLTWLFFYGWY